MLVSAERLRSTRRRVLLHRCEGSRSNRLSSLGVVEYGILVNAILRLPLHARGSNGLETLALDHQGGWQIEEDRLGQIDLLSKVGHLDIKGAVKVLAIWHPVFLEELVIWIE